MTSDKRIAYILKKISDIIPDAELRTHDPDYTYICAYDTSNDISIRISFHKACSISSFKTALDGTNHTQYQIECMGNSKLNRSIKEEESESFECYYMILDNIIKSANINGERCAMFPKYTKYDNRTSKIDLITSEKP